MSEKYLMSISCDGECEVCEHYKKAYLLEQKFKETNKGLNKVRQKRKKWKYQYYKEKNKNKELKDRINKAVECIEKVLNSYKENPENALGLNIIGLLEILKEDNKEE